MLGDIVLSLLFVWLLAIVVLSMIGITFGMVMVMLTIIKVIV
ncbi:hypothetical protein LCGC14_3094930 [marine sediment metagenome]|uniref:Uncharacterized protein n=1 Tax=marine sediment metagenome TaxID=412755 RepID=A0A0F8W9I3_9ZZZZ